MLLSAYTATGLISAEKKKTLIALLEVLKEFLPYV